MKRLILVIISLILLIGNIVLYHYWSRKGQVITISADNMLLAQVIAQIEKKADIEVITNADPATPITLHVKKMPVVKVLKQLAGIIDAYLYLSYKLAADAQTIDEHVKAFESSEDHADEWVSYYLPPPDLPTIFTSEEEDVAWHLRPWSMPDSPASSLQKLLRQASASNAACFEIPRLFDAQCDVIPHSGTLEGAVAKIAKSAGAAARQIYVLRVEPVAPNQIGEIREQRQMPSGPQAPPRWAVRPDRDTMERHKQTVMDSIRAHIKKLNHEQAAEAAKTFELLQKIRDTMEDLPEEERKKAHAELLSSSKEMQDLVLDQGGKWASNSTPEERKNYYSNYLDKKQAGGEEAP